MIRTTRMLLAVGVCLALTGCVETPQENLPPATDAAVDVIRMAAVGDSITAGDSPDLAGGVPGLESWVHYAIGPDVELVGGWAEPGASISQMAEAVTVPFEADVLVILAGTNDAEWISREEIDSGLRSIVDRAGVETIVLSSVPPNDLAIENTLQLNESLEITARQNGWTWVDSSAGLREGERFAEGMTYDGVHPTQDGARVIGEAIHAAVLEAVSVE
ncbi:SGNH/GDSL hydrolase family protein [uncultured Agrococcus sp.]|uniref:SGNH/GDSL hydrolase family protein n=1 Tax=uncultured Agrococcus sp. TaxID=382258 RepID=UPI0025F529C3|nr:SGNH/GDSL hydrolase family protein [uncultured Agrococcus sp.]